MSDKQEISHLVFASLPLLPPQGRKTRAAVISRGEVAEEGKQAALCTQQGTKDDSAELVTMEAECLGCWEAYWLC